ncbi:DUF3182 family protein [Ancylobacter oerskovii]|uniref:DUF3182 family protein n=1 Tax=Ancylobacter oerskovii TaxID=459519 RepID=A0ABW4Z3C4_9HYPH|nr:DUF3182 family protein [Ancylobacter oerskovii]MBS7546033.1 DUF3182 family protein [Ancylobacter oerskovii]
MGSLEGLPLSNRPVARPTGAAVALVAEPGDMLGHRHQAVEALARRIASLRGSPILTLSEGGMAQLRVYAVPVETLVGGEFAARLGIESERDFFGGLVPYAVQAGKAITHPLPDDDATRPEGWSNAFGLAVREVVPAGFSAFDIDAARRAAGLLLPRGPLRVKPGWSDGGREQAIVADAVACEAALAALERDLLAEQGVVLEEDLSDAVTFSIGRVRIDDTILSYVGQQSTTRDNAGVAAYGGSTLTVVPGDLEALLALELDATARRAVECALVYDGAAMQHFPGLIASRRNYDVIAGRDARGKPRIGVLEQSWRIGGASGAEIAAFEAFHDEPDLVAVRTSCTERYGAIGRRAGDLPDDSFVYYQGDDPVVGPLLKYATIEARYRAS